MADKGVEHVPTVESRAKVLGFACAGFTQERIANYFDIAVNTLRKHYKYELEDAKLDRTMQLGDNLFKDALEGDKQSREFWLKCQGGWSYAKSQEDKDKDDKQITLMEKLIDKL